MACSVEVTATPVAICLSHHSAHSLCLERLGGLNFVRGTHLRSSPYPSNPALPRFAGISALTTSPNIEDELIGITDLGAWTTLRKQQLGTYNVTLSSLLDDEGRPLAARGKEWSDAEGLTRVSDSLLVSFERQHRVWKYYAPEHAGVLPGTANRLDTALDVALSVALSSCDGGGRGNNGVEALEMLNETHLLAICEGPERGHSESSAPSFVFDMRPASSTTVADRVRRARYELSDGFAPTALARLPADQETGASRGMLVLERAYDPSFGSSARLRWLPSADVDAAARGDGPTLSGPLLLELLPTHHVVDNFEGMAVVRSEDGHAAQVYLISDDNASPSQRTLLFEFHLPLCDHFPLPLRPTASRLRADCVVIAP